MHKPSIDELADYLGENPDLEPKPVLLETVRMRMSKEEWESRNHRAKSVITALKEFSRTDLSIDNNRPIYLPLWIDDYNFDWIQAVLNDMFHEQEYLEVIGTPAWVYRGTVLPELPPEHARTMSHEMQAAMASDAEYGTMAIAFVNGEPLSKLETMRIRHRPRQGQGREPGPGPGPDGDWLDRLMQYLDQQMEEGAIDVERANLPASLKNYNVLSAYLRPGSVMLFSPNKGEGLYVIARQVNMHHPDLGVRNNIDFDTAIRMFYTDPLGYLEGEGIVPEEEAKSEHGRLRLYLRYWLAGTEQGAYINRSGPRSLPVIDDYVQGNPMDDVPTGLLEHLDRLSVLFD